MPDLRLGLCALPLIFGSLAGCAHIDTGEIRIGRPHVYDSETTRLVLSESGKRVVGKIREGAKPGSASELLSSQELQAARLGVTAQPGAIPGAPNATPPAGYGAAPKLPEATSTANLSGTLTEQIDDILVHEGRAVQVELMHSGAGDAELLGPNARIYLVRFDFSLFPTRQMYWNYPIWWIHSGLGGAYNFTQGWFAETRFWLPELRNGGGDPLLYVYGVEPRNDTVTANEGLAQLNSGELNLQALVPQGAARVDYLRQLQEQFAQQRRYPLQTGSIHGESKFSWTFGPRRRVTRRSWLVRWIPFVSTYKVSSRLEPGPRHGHVVIVVPDIVALRDAVGKARKASTNADEGKFLLSRQFEACEADPFVQIPIAMLGAYVELDRPMHGIPVRMEGAQPDDIQPEEGVFENLFADLSNAELERLSATPIRLPVGPPALEQSATMRATARSLGKTRARITIEVTSGPDLKRRPVRAVSLSPAELDELPMTVRSFEGRENGQVDVVVDRPKNEKAKDGEKPVDAGKPISLNLRAEITTATERFVGTLPQLAFEPAADEIPKPAQLAISPEVGSAGELLTITFPEAKQLEGVTGVHIGRGFEKVPGERAWIDAKKKALYVIVPQAPSAGYVAAIVLDSKRGKESLGAFRYLAPPR